MIKFEEMKKALVKSNFVREGNFLRSVDPSLVIEIYFEDEFSYSSIYNGKCWDECEYENPLEVAEITQDLVREFID